MLQEILAWMAGKEAADGTKAVDSGGFSISRYIDWCHAKYVTISVKLFAKLHLIHTMQGKICAAIVTPGKANDLLYLREMIRMLPHGSGDLLGDGAYRIIANCNAIRERRAAGHNQTRLQLHHQGIQRKGRDVEVP